jgi:hypothetical protein
LFRKNNFNRDPDRDGKISGRACLKFSGHRIRLVISTGTKALHPPMH